MSNTSMVYIALLALVIFWAVGAHNRLVRLKNAIARDFGAVDTQLRLRHAQIAQLLEMTGPRLNSAALDEVRLAMAPAAAALDAARGHPSSGRTMASFADAERLLEVALSQLWRSDAVTQALRVDPGLRQVAEGMGGLQDKLDFACEPYNQAVHDFNEAQAEFPTLLIARMFGFWPSAQLRMAELQASRELLRALLQ